MVRIVQTVTMAFPEFEVVLRSDVGKGDYRSVSGYKIDTRPYRNKQQEIADLINKYGDIILARERSTPNNQDAIMIMPS